MPKDGMHNIYKRNGVYWARKKIAGTEHRESLRTDSISEAKKKRDEFLERIEREYDGNRRTWKSAVVRWNDDVEVAESTKERYLISIQNVTPVIGDLYLDEVNTKATLGTTVAERRKMGVTTATIKRDLTAVSSVLDVAEALDWIETNIARDYARRLKERRDPIVLPREEDIDYVVSRAPGKFANMIRFAQYTGMRQEEIASLTWGQIRRRHVDLGVTKTKTHRTVELDDRAGGTIEGTAKYPKSQVVFWHGKGERYRNVASQFRRIIRQCIRSAEKEGRDFRPFRFHDLRHWYAVDYLRHPKPDQSIYTLQKTLGHKSVKMTEGYLDYLTPAESERAQKGAQQRWFDEDDKDGNED